MPKRVLQSVLILGLMTGTSWAASDPFVGTWKLDPSRSQLSDEMKVEALGGNKYAFDFGGGKPVTVVADGTDQPIDTGTTMSVSAEGPNTWKFVGKKDGRVGSGATWKLSEDGSTLSDSYTVYQADGSTLHLDYLYKRTAGSSGFAGTWDSTSEKVDSVYEIAIRPYRDNGLSFVDPAEKSTQDMEFDGRDYPSQGPDVTAGSVSSGQRMNDSTLDITDKINGKVTDTRELKLSSDLRTLTMTVRPVGRATPNILVFGRE
jgi:hypothetical protein